MQAHRKPAHAGIVVKHRGPCASRAGGRCNCRPAYQAAVWSARERKRIRRHFRTLAEAKAWRADSLVALRRGTMRAPTSLTVFEAAEAWLAGVRSSTIVNRRRQAYKPSAIRAYERALRLRVLPELGHLRLSSVERRDVQDLADRLLAQGLDPATVRNTICPLAAICRRAVVRGDLAVNPTHGLELRAPAGRRDRIATPEEAMTLLAALPLEERALWATALYAGLRRGELRALRWTNVDLDAGILRVERAWDDVEGEIEGKSRAARRTVPIAVALRSPLLQHRLRTGRNGDELIFASGDGRAFDPSTVRRRAIAAWRAAELEPIGLHECRHTFASLMIAAGVNAKALCTYMGHSSVAITFDRYGHLMPGNEQEAAALLDAYLASGR